MLVNMPEDQAHQGWRDRHGRTVPSGQCLRRRSCRVVPVEPASRRPSGILRSGLPAPHFARSGTCTKSPWDCIGQRRLVHCTGQRLTLGLARAASAVVNA